MKNKKTLWAVIGAAVLVLVLAVVYFKNRPAASSGQKHVIVEVNASESSQSVYETNTSEEYLEGLMNQLMKETDFSYAGVSSDYGMMVTEINGVKAEYEVDKTYWAIYVNGEYGSYGISEQPVADGDTFTFAVEK